MPTKFRKIQLDRRQEHNMSSPLLALPGEMRNRIYHHVASEHSAQLTTRRRAAKAYGAGPRPERIVSFRERKSLGLTQVCTRLREEFLPIHLASLRCKIDSRESATYMATFYPTWVPQNVPISKNLEDLAYTTCDFLPILRLHSVGVKVFWHRLNEDHGIDTEMSHILSIGGSNRAWCNFLMLKVSKFEYRVGVPTSLKIVVKSSAKEAWMPWNAQNDVDNVSVETHRAMAKFKIFNGMGQLKKMPHVLVEEE